MLDDSRDGPVAKHSFRRPIVDRLREAMTPSHAHCSNPAKTGTKCTILYKCPYCGYQFTCTWIKAAFYTVERMGSKIKVPAHMEEPLPSLKSCIGAGMRPWNAALERPLLKYVVVDKRAI